MRLSVHALTDTAYSLCCLFLATRLKCITCATVQVAVRALGLLIENTGEVVSPYLQYPDLMSALLGVLNRGSSVPWSLRSEVLRTIGIIGAVDPYQLNQANLAVFRRNAAAALNHSSTTITTASATDAASGLAAGASAVITASSTAAAGGPTGQSMAHVLCRDICAAFTRSVVL